LGLTREDIDSVALLSRLELSDHEKQRLTVQINKLLGDFQKLQEIDTSGVEPTSHAMPVFNVFREDLVRPSLAAEEVVANGPQVEENCFVVPRIVET